MPNTYFQFKQFRIEQDKCAMKVCTDSCVFGSYVPVHNAERVLDIGAGTGLLSLMVAQRSNAHVEAVEINANAQQQALENFSISPWANRLHLHACSLQELAQQEHQPFDVILSNPPFFISSLKSPDQAINAARHAEKLFFEDILRFSQKNLTQNGKLHLLLPPAEATLFKQLAVKFGLYLTNTLQLYTQVNGKCFRYILTFAFKKEEQTVEELNIREADGKTYTPDFVKLLREFYLIF